MRSECYEGEFHQLFEVHGEFFGNVSCMNLSLRVSLDKRDKIKICNMLNALNEEWL